MKNKFWNLILSYLSEEKDIVSGGVHSFPLVEIQAESSPLIAQSQFLNQIAEEIYKQPKKYCYLQCLGNNYDIQLFINCFLSHLLTLNISNEFILQTIASGEISIRLWKSIMKEISSQLSCTYFYGPLCDRFGCILTKERLNSTIITYPKYMTILETYGKNLMKTKHVYIVHSPGHLQKYHGFSIVPLELKKNDSINLNREAEDILSHENKL